VVGPGVSKVCMVSSPFLSADPVNGPSP
jgi:hypothetical protein